MAILAKDLTISFIILPLLLTLRHTTCGLMFEFAEKQMEDRRRKTFVKAIPESILMAGYPRTITISIPLLLEYPQASQDLYCT
jgi:hypothetical protein